MITVLSLIILVTSQNSLTSVLQDRHNEDRDMEVDASNGQDGRSKSPSVGAMGHDMNVDGNNENGTQSKSPSLGAMGREANRHGHDKEDDGKKNEKPSSDPQLIGKSSVIRISGTDTSTPGQTMI